METTDYSNSQIILNMNHGNTRKYSHSYPPSFMNINDSKDFKNSFSDVETKRTSLFPEIRRKSLTKDYQCDQIYNQLNKDIKNHVQKEISYGEDNSETNVPSRDSYHTPLQSNDSYNEFPHLQEFEISLEEYNLDNISIISYESDDNDDDDDNDNAMVPGLFPKLDINKNFLKFDKLPLNPSYIAH
ncbi:hypothetical protein CLIB1444_06S02344 [[Candida] jaroonii]|uniref:Uncharacterized protein n=1 Tax=[Candida] jaroonii TaxID=467808 RepID=A0ACA9Y8Y4_9ASCO|nr:hypothetical protein CLIB1444_06S02344 [[Candida] jaroonii]